jgi:hypothetical protein
VQGAQTLWLSAPLTWCELDGDWVVYQPANGLVCDLDVLSAWVLASLEQHENSLDGLCLQAACAAEGEPVASDAGAVIAALKGLLQAGLIDAKFASTVACA